MRHRVTMVRVALHADLFIASVDLRLSSREVVFATLRFSLSRGGSFERPGDRRVNTRGIESIGKVGRPASRRMADYELREECHHHPA